MKKTANQANDFLNKMEKLFRAELGSGDQHLTELVDESPVEYREQTAKLLLSIEIKYYSDHNWTYFADIRKRQFPELTDFIDQCLSSGWDQADVETISELSLVATTKLVARKGAWKQGGQGAIHKANDETIGNREVAVKILKDANRRDQFEKEVYVTANLNHPGIVAVYAKGAASDSDSAGRPFYSMRLLRGETLAEKLERLGKQRLTSQFFQSDEFTALVSSMISVCNTIGYAHHRGVLHCDIKPSNISCGEFNATVVLDWGSARKCASASHTTLNLEAWDSENTMTPAYASPEQLERAELSPASDIYSIGATLYHIITGKVPERQDLRHYAETKDFVDDSNNEDEINSIGREVPRALAAICKKAMATSIADRYASASDLADDLQHWLRDEEVTAAPDGLVARAFRFSRRHKTLAVSSLLLLTMACAMSLLLMWNGKSKALSSSKLKSTFQLIDHICEPLVRDETVVSQEFARLAVDLNDFATEYINVYGKNKKIARLDPEIAKANQVLAVVNYFYYNKQAPDKSSKDDDTDRRSVSAVYLSRAITNIETAEEKFQRILNSGDASVGKDLALCRLVKSRLLYKRLNDAATPNYDQLQAALAPLNAATRYFVASKQNSERLWLAECRHMRGEILLKYASLSERGEASFDDWHATLTTAAEQFASSIKLRNSAGGLAKGSGTGRVANVVLRDLGRGYGYLGDVQAKLGDIDLAVSSYERSRNFRQQLADRDNDEEHRFQLARGHANFGRLALKHGDDYENFLKKRGDIPHLDVPFEIYIAEQYVAEGIMIGERLSQLGDTRYQSDLASRHLLMAELHYFAALDNCESETLLVYSDAVKKHVARAQQLLNYDASNLGRSNNPNGDHTATVATSIMLEVQMAKLLKDEVVLAEKLQNLGSLLKDVTQNVGIADVATKELLPLCVFLDSTAAYNAETALDALASRNDVSNYRIVRHFNVLRSVAQD